MKLFELFENTDANELHEYAKLARNALKKPGLLRGISDPEAYASQTFDLGKGIKLSVMNARTDPRQSLTGNSLMMHLTKIHPEWKKMQFPDRSLSVYCSNSEYEATDFGSLALVLPYDSVKQFGIIKGDFNLVSTPISFKNVYEIAQEVTTIFSSYTGIMQTIKTLLSKPTASIVDKLKGPFDEYNRKLDDLKRPFDEYNSKRSLKFKNASIDDFIKSIKDMPLYKLAIKSDVSEIPMDEEGLIRFLKHLDDLYNALKESDEHLLIQLSYMLDMHLSVGSDINMLDKIAIDGKVSDGILHTISPSEIGAQVGTYSDVVKLFSPSAKTHEIWFRGPYLIVYGGDYAELINAVKELRKSI